MVADAEKFKAEDNAQKVKIEARNELENRFQVKDPAGDLFGNQMNLDNKAAIEKSSKDNPKWFDTRHDKLSMETEGKISEGDGV